MKKLLLAFFIVTASFCNAQNYMDYSQKEIINALSLKGESYDFDYTKDGTKYLYVTDRIFNTYKYYYFDDNNRCFTYMVIYGKADYSILIELLDKNYTRSGSRWYDENCTATLEYNSELKSYVTTFVRKQKIKD